MKARERILVIRLGALGDIVLCFQAFHEIRRAHPDADIAFLTMPAFAGFARKMPWFDRVIIDPRPSGVHLDQWRRLVTDIRAFRPTRVYDLQGKLRQSILFTLLGGPFGPQWSGRAPLCSHPRFDPPQPGMHYTEFVARQLRLAGVPEQSPADLSWLDGDISIFALPSRYAVIVPGCAPHREYKRWPARNFAELTGQLASRGIASVAVGTIQDVGAIAAIRAAGADVTDLSGRTDLLQLAGLMRGAEAVIGNDTGPVHMAAALGKPALALISERVDAAWSAPHGPRAGWRQGKPLAMLGVVEALLALDPLLDKNADRGAKQGIEENGPRRITQ
jgi:ADP-heptose:LPS heptosyltransferase